ncbi:MAG: hypothetical protein QG635_678 [Bacteroidota bacterium]|nr:hypothetical protein [Bacteroidota bacterium]
MLRIIMIVVVAVIALILIVMIFLPKNYHVERSIGIKAPINIVFDNIHNFHKWEKWDPWMKIDTTQKRTYKGTGIGVGSAYTWVSENEQVGKGTMTIMESIPPTEIKILIEFEHQRQSNSQFHFEEKDGLTKLVWSISGEVGFFWRWFALMMDGAVGPLFEKGLSNLKNLCEKMPPPKVIMEVVDIKPIHIIYIADSMPVSDMNGISESFARCYGELGKFLNDNSINITAPHIAVTMGYDKMYSYQAAIPVPEGDYKPSGRIKYRIIPGGKFVKAVHIGPYEESMSVYEAITKYIKNNNLQINGKTWEEYINDPSSVKPEELITNIYFPVK